MGAQVLARARGTHTMRHPSMDDRTGIFRRTVPRMWTVLIILLVAWAVLSIVGFAFEGLLWLAIIGIVLFLGTVIFGIIRSRSRRRTT